MIKRNTVSIKLKGIFMKKKIVDLVKGSSLRKKLFLSFLMVTLVTISLSIAFSIIYFFDKIRNEALNNMRKNIQVAELMYNSKMEKIDNFANNLSNDKTLQLLVDLDIRNKLSQYLKEIVNRDKIYNIEIYDKYGKLLSNTGLSNSILVLNKSNIDSLEEMFLEKAFQKNPVTSNEKITIYSNLSVLSITSSYPIIRNGVVIGVAIVRYVINEDSYIVDSINKIIGVNAVIFKDATPISFTEETQIDKKIYNTLTTTQKNSYEVVKIGFGGALEQYKTIYDINKKAVGVLAINISSNKYAMTILTSILYFLFIMVCCIIITSVIGYFVSKSIIIPVTKLVAGADKIKSGDLTYEIKFDNLKDEIGKLSESFNLMRLALSEKITYIEDMNLNLENTVKERTDVIESLLNKMKKYLSPQLYEAILEGSKDVDTRKHTRKKLTIFFSDVVGFTSTTDSMEAEDISELLNSYLDSMAKIALKWGGTIDKFVGDAIMVFFGDPEFISDKIHALNAVSMALEMREKMVILRQEWKDMGVDKPLHIRMGINTGYCTIGNFGSENRMDYTIIGGNVNLAARLETAAESDTILISHETYSLIKDQIECQYMGELNYKGLKEPIKTYKVNKIINKPMSTETDFIKITNDNVILKSISINPKSLTKDQKELLISSLRLAISFAEENSKTNE